MNYRLSAVAAVLCFAAAANAQWTNDTNGATNPNSAGIGVASHANIKLRIAQTAVDSPNGTSQLSFGTTTATWWAWRLDSNNDLHLDRQNNGWYEGVVFDRTGNVGIGMDAPGTRLDVRGTAIVYGTARRVARFWDDTAMLAGVGAGVDFLGKYTSAGAYTQFANVKGVKENGTDGDFTGNLVVSVNNSSGYVVERVRITPTTTTITGDLSVTGNVQAKYQDVAEWVPAIDDVVPGMVVIVAADESNKVAASTDAYDTRVAGVASGQPGLILGEAGPSKVMIATTGRVKVRVDATAAPIKAGDLLVTSGKRGMAMKSLPVDVAGVKMHRPGTVVGKALESLPSGEGEILVLLSLQ